MSPKKVFLKYRREHPLVETSISEALWIWENMVQWDVSAPGPDNSDDDSAAAVEANIRGVCQAIEEATRLIFAATRPPAL